MQKFSCPFFAYPFRFLKILPKLDRMVEEALLYFILKTSHID